MKKYLWLDLETAGLASDAPILEIYCMMGDETGHEEPFHAVIQHDITMLQNYMEPYVYQMHTNNGLLKEVPNGLPLEQVEHALIQHLKDCLSTKKPLTLAGSSVQYDLTWLKHHMPLFAKYLHYAIFDVSSLWHLLHERFDETFSDDRHRAESDVRASYRQFRYYHAHIMNTHQSAECQTAGSLRNTLATFPDDTPLCVDGVFDEFRPVNVDISFKLFKEDELLQDNPVSGVTLAVTPLFD